MTASAMAVACRPHGGADVLLELVVGELGSHDEGRTSTKTGLRTMVFSGLEEIKSRLSTHQEF
jgi:hypothetical protein